MALSALNQHMALAKMAVEETGRGVYEDKCLKNIYASENIWHNIKKIKQSALLKIMKLIKLLKLQHHLVYLQGLYQQQIQHQQQSSNHLFR